WESDIDSVYSGPASIPEAIKNSEKMLFDMIMFHTFGELPGTLFDTETFVEHAATSLDTSKWMKSEAGLASFHRIELNSISLQSLRQCGGERSNAWQEYQATMIRQAKTTELRRALAESFSDVVRMERDVEEAVLDQMCVERGVDPTHRG